MDRYLESASRDQGGTTRRSDAWASSHFDVDLDGGFQNRVHRRGDVMLDCLTASCSALQCQLDKVGLQYRNISNLTDEGSREEDGRGQDPFAAGSYRINSATWKDWETSLDTGGVVWSGALHTRMMHAGSRPTGAKWRRDVEADCSIRAIR